MARTTVRPLVLVQMLPLDVGGRTMGFWGEMVKRKLQIIGMADEEGREERG